MVPLIFILITMVVIFGQRPARQKPITPGIEKSLVVICLTGSLIGVVITGVATIGLYFERRKNAKVSNEEEYD